MEVSVSEKVQEGSQVYNEIDLGLKEFHTVFLVTVCERGLLMGEGHVCMFVSGGAHFHLRSKMRLVFVCKNTHFNFKYFDEGVREDQFVYSMSNYQPLCGIVSTCNQTFKRSHLARLRSLCK